MNANKNLINCKGGFLQIPSSFTIVQDDNLRRNESFTLRSFAFICGYYVFKILSEKKGRF